MRKGKSKAYLRELRRKHGLGEFSKSSGTKKRTGRKARPRGFRAQGKPIDEGAYPTGRGFDRFPAQGIDPLAIKDWIPDRFGQPTQTA